MNVIYYKFKSDKPDDDYRTIDLYSDKYITVEDLKKRICFANKMFESKKNSFDLVIKDEERKEDYTDDKILIPINKRVIVMRIPNHAPEIVKAYKTGKDPFAGIPRSQRSVKPLEWVPPPIFEKKTEISLCGICENEINDRTMTPCCRRESCYECITEKLLDSNENECPYCLKEGLEPLKLLTGSDLVVEKSEDLKKKTSNDQPMPYRMSFHQPSPVVSTYERQARSHPNQLYYKKSYDQPLPYQPTHNPQPVVSIYPGQATMGSHQPHHTTFHQPSHAYYDQRMEHQPTHYTDPQWYRPIPPNQGVVPKIGSRYTSNPQPAYIDDPLEAFNRYLEQKDREKKIQQNPERSSRPSKRDRSRDSEDRSISNSRSKRNKHGDDSSN